MNRSDCVHLSNVRAAANYPESRAWIASTRKLIASADQGVLEQAEQQLHYETMKEIKETLSKAMALEWTPDMQHELGRILKSALQFFRLLHRHPADFRMAMVPAVYANGDVVAFDPTRMEDVGVEDEDGSQGRELAISVFPITCKKGDENGENVSRPKPL